MSENAILNLQNLVVFNNRKKEITIAAPNKFNRFEVKVGDTLMSDEIWGLFRNVEGTLPFSENKNQNSMERPGYLYNSIM